ncbi:MAG: hypothetical protein AABW51_04545 [Nanoarchaeota archaeon]
MKNITKRLNYEFIEPKGTFDNPRFKEFRDTVLFVLRPLIFSGAFGIGLCSLVNGGYAYDLLHSGKSGQETKEKIKSFYSAQPGGKLWYYLGKPGEELVYLIHGENKK